MRILNIDNDQNLRLSVIYYTRAYLRANWKIKYAHGFFKAGYFIL